MRRLGGGVGDAGDSCDDSDPDSDADGGSDRLACNSHGHVNVFAFTEAGATELRNRCGQGQTVIEPTP